MFNNVFPIEARPGEEVTVIDGFEESLGDRTKAGCMEERHEVAESFGRAMGKGGNWLLRRGAVDGPQAGRCASAS